MPVSPHPNCHEPLPATVICRFTDFRKFYDLLATEELYFRRTDLFKETDPQEALASDQYLGATLGLRRYDINDEIRLIDTQGFDLQNSEAYDINSWQIFEGETLEMYGRYGTGVVVFSRFDLLRAAIDAFIDPMYVGIVRYGEKDLRGVNLINFLFTKRKCFDKERELRIVLQSYNPVGGANRHFRPRAFNREPLNELYPLLLRSKTMATNLATVKEATEALGISRSTLWRRIRSGEISSISCGGRRLVQLPSRRASKGAKLAGDIPPFTGTHPIFRLIGAGRGSGHPGARDKHAILDE